MKSFVYAICYDNPEPVFIYVGVTSRTIQQRYSEHLKGIKDTSNDKDLYVYIRKNSLVDRVYIVEVDQIDDGQNAAWEKHYVEAFITAGYPLQNMKAGDKKVAKKRKVRTDVPVVEKKKRFDWGNNDPDPSQSFSKSDKFREKVKATVPTVEELVNAPWQKASVVNKKENKEFFTRGNIVIYRSTYSKKKRNVTVINRDANRKMSLFNDGCDDFLKLYALTIENWLDKGWEYTGINLWSNFRN